jgi:hypothetical protein
MLILAVSIICAALLGGVYYLAYKDFWSAIGIGILLFIALDMFQRSALNRKFPIKLRR